MSVLPLLANLGFAASGVPASLAFRRALDRPRETQTRLLLATLARNAGTAVGRRYGFAGIRSLEEYRERVPLSTWDDMEDDVLRVARGARGVLTREPVRVLEWSSGSTRAAKLIPFTDTLQAELRRAVGVWLADLFLHEPTLAAGPAYWSISPAHEPPLVEGATVPIGFLQDAQYLGGRAARLVEAALAVPASLARLRDPEQHARATLVALLGRRDLRLMSVWHPSFLTLLVGSLRERWEELLRDVASGLRLDAASLRLPPRPARARELASVGPGDLSAVWPRLGLISCWTDGPARRSLPPLREAFPGVRVQGKGLLATEGVVTIPLGGPGGDLRPLAITSHVFDFLEEGRGTEGRALAAWELEPGRSYSVLLTTGGGLYRYRLGDRVRVSGLLGRTPCLEFVGKEDNVSDIRGEKLSEGFVGAVIDGLLGEYQLEAGFAMLAPEIDDAPGEGAPGYALFLATPGPLPEGLTAELERRLADNPHYALCARLGQLAPARVVPVGADAPQRVLRRLAAEGRRLGDVKPTALSPKAGWRAWLLGGGDAQLAGVDPAGGARSSGASARSGAR